MLGQALTLGALVVLVHSKAIVTNNCKRPVYVWSVPGGVQGDIIPPGSSYEEPFHRGVPNPGIAIKLSEYPNGIYEGKDELDFAYTVNHYQGDKVWIQLDSARHTTPFNGDVAFWTCWGSYKTTYVPTRQCSIFDNAELVLCGSERAQPANDSERVDSCTGPWEGRRRPRNCNGRIVEPKRVMVKKEDPKQDEKPKKEDNDKKEAGKPSGCNCTHPWDQDAGHDIKKAFWGWLKEEEKDLKVLLCDLFPGFNKGFYKADSERAVDGDDTRFCYISESKLTCISSESDVDNHKRSGHGDALLCGAKDSEWTCPDDDSKTDERRSVNNRLQDCHWQYQ